MKEPIDFLYEMTGDTTEEDLRVSLSVDYNLEDIMNVMELYASHVLEEVGTRLFSNVVNVADSPGIDPESFDIKLDTIWPSKQ